MSEIKISIRVEIGANAMIGTVHEVHNTTSSGNHTFHSYEVAKLLPALGSAVIKSIEGVHGTRHRPV